MSGVKITLDAGESAAVGAMTVRNDNDDAITLTVQGDGPVLREKMIIRAEDATTPALKVYHLVTQMYLDPNAFDTLREPFLRLSRELVESVPSTGVFMADIGEHIAEGDYAGAYRKTFLLLEYEELLAKAAESRSQGSEGGD